jgi:outer membrane protein assembly factor BamE (lipoprotein component of BamABCDE complex)
LRKATLASLRLRASLPAVAGLLLGASALAGCNAQIDRHGHVFMDVDVYSVQPGMTKEQVTNILGSPDTKSTIRGDAYYYISTTQKTVAFLKPREIDRQVVAVYFDGGDKVQEVGHYGLKDGIVVNYMKDETPARGKDLSFLEQVFGNIANRGQLKGVPTRGMDPTRPGG